MSYIHIVTHTYCHKYVRISDGSSASRVSILANTLPEGIVLTLSVSLKVPRRIAGETQQTFQTNPKPFGGVCFAEPDRGNYKISNVIKHVNHVIEFRLGSSNLFMLWK